MFNSRSTSASRLLAAIGAGLSLVTGVATAASTPYSGTAVTIPATVQAENYDKGGAGVAYYDTTATNIGGRYRPKEAVDISVSPTSSSGNIISHFESGEWLVYTIRVATAGSFDIEALVGSGQTGSAYHVEIDGQPVTGRIVVPNSGNWNTYQWLGKTRVSLATGTHLLKIVSEQPYFGLDAIRFTAAPTATPYSGTPSAVPGTIEAENFDRGGQGVAYYDTTSGNTQGQYRTAEDVEIAVSPDTTTGGFIVSHFEAGEWLVYTINAASAGEYDIEIRAGTTMADTAYHFELDGQRLTERTVVPPAADWNTYRWLGKTRVALPAGRHLLKIVSEQPYFGLDAIRISAPTTASSGGQVFSSGFEGSLLNIVPPLDCWGTGCWQDLIGLDSLSGFNWPGNLWGGGGKFLMLSDPVVTTPLTIGNYLFNRIEPVIGHKGNSTGALLQQITQNANGAAPMGTSPMQNEFTFTPPREGGDLYVSYWIKLQPDLVQKMNNLPAGPGISGGGTWRSFFAFKTGGQTAWGAPADNGDYRVEVYVMTYGGGQPYWMVLADNNAGGGAPVVNSWTSENRIVPVPVGQWFKFEAFWHRSAGNDGRVWVAANGQTITDYRGPTMGAWNLPINRIMAPLLYSGSAMPIYQWIDDLEIREGFPAAGNDPPYAAH